MPTKSARRTGLVAGLALVPAVAFGVAANAATTDAPQPPAAQQAQHPHAGQHRHKGHKRHGQRVKVDGMITKVETKKVRDHDVRLITVQSKGEDGKLQDRTFVVAKRATVVDQSGKPVSADQLAQGKKVTLEGRYSAERHHGVAHKIKITS